ncbi:uncharacterized protein LOC102803234 [Saccoglossus kowalevskii]|uniref:Neurotrophin-4-like n=1 Tax=Saccoglossus kowalevskii TaxID=10224 RepID=A0ABM0MNK7_SACKO|nr:PREDICTED: neurotrophin-4-like [Saccoglossus kowalevskii]
MKHCLEMMDEATYRRMVKLFCSLLILMLMCLESVDTASRSPRTYRYIFNDRKDTEDDDIHVGHHIPHTNYENINDISNQNPALLSNLVTFSTARPTTPPWHVTSFPDPNTYDDDTEKSESHNRDKRRVMIHPEMSVCDSKSGWVTKKWATDIYGQNVTVLSMFKIRDNTTIGQYFYETSCKTTGETAPPENNCRGIDTHEYSSVCKEKKTWAYAMIQTTYGTEDWDWIAIKTSCVCALQRREEPLIRSTRDALLFALLRKLRK